MTNWLAGRKRHKTTAPLFEADPVGSTPEGGKVWVSALWIAFVAAAAVRIAWELAR